MKNRLRYNLEILEEIVKYTMEHPELRFVQILWSLNIINRDIDGNLMDRFYEEPDVTLLKVKEQLIDGYKTSKKN
jgi:hypothetical protein